MRRSRTPALLAAALLAASCAAKPAPEPPAAPPPAAHGGFAQCLHANGVPDSAGPAVLGPPDGVDPATWSRAMQACSPLAPGPARP